MFGLVSLLASLATGGVGQVKVGGTSRGKAPRPVVYFEGDNAVWSGSNLTSWPAEIGKPGVIQTGCTAPVKGSTANSHQGVMFDAANHNLLYVGNVVPVAADLTMQVVFSSTRTTGNRQYMLRSYAVIDTDDIIAANMANLTPSHLMTGYFDGAAGSDADPGSGWHVFKRTNWRAVQTKVSAKASLHVDTFVLGASGARFYRDGVLEGTNAQYTQRRLTDLHIGGSAYDGSGCLGIADDTAFDGTIYQIKIWNRALGQATALNEQNKAMSRFGLTAWPPSSTDPVAIFGSDLVAWYDTSDPNYLEYSDQLQITAVRDRVDAADIATTGSGTASYDQDGYSTRPAIRVGGTSGSLRDDSTATEVYTTGSVGATQGVTLFAVMHNCTDATSNDGPVAAFGAAAAANPRFDMSIISGVASPWVRSVQLQDSGTSRSTVSVADPGTSNHLVIATQDEVADTATIEMDKITATSGVVNLGTTTLNSFAIGRRYSNGVYTGNGSSCVYITSLGAVKHAITAGERTSLRAWACAVYGVSC